MSCKHKKLQDKILEPEFDGPVSRHEDQKEPKMTIERFCLDCGKVVMRRTTGCWSDDVYEHWEDY